MGEKEEGEGVGKEEGTETREAQRVKDWENLWSISESDSEGGGGTEVEEREEPCFEDRAAKDSCWGLVVERL
jgi:hypothetical protein